MVDLSAVSPQAKFVASLVVLTIVVFGLVGAWNAPLPPDDPLRPSFETARWVAGMLGASGIAITMFREKMGAPGSRVVEAALGAVFPLLAALMLTLLLR